MLLNYWAPGWKEALSARRLDSRGINPLIPVGEGHAKFTVNVRATGHGNKTAYGESATLALVAINIDAKIQARHPRDAELDLILSGFL